LTCLPSARPCRLSLTRPPGVAPTPPKHPTPQILLLDEATSALDVESERVVQVGPGAGGRVGAVASLHQAIAPGGTARAGPPLRRADGRAACAAAVNWCPQRCLPSLTRLLNPPPQAALDALVVGRTTVVVAHRLSTIKGADVIAVVKEVREPRGRAYLI
jgi:hypothetical protein